jgi:PAS domain S-box-containing protein
MLVGIPKQHILHAADLQMLGDLTLLGGAAAATMALVWILGNIVLVKPLASLVSATERFGAGEMKARTDLPYTADELGKLAKSFDEMAALLERRNAERENAEEALQKTNSELQQHREQLEHEVARRTAELRQSEERYRRIVDTAQEGITVLDSEGRVTYANRRMAEMLGYASEELLGRSILDSAPESMRGQKAQHLQRRRQGIREQYEFCFRRKDGSDLWTLISASPLLDGEGKFIGSMGLITDITAGKRSQVELGRLNRALATLSKCDEALIHATDEPSLLTEICEIVIRTGGYRMAWVTYPGGKPDDPILPAAKAGFEEGYLEKIHLTWADAERGLGVIGAAMRTRQPCVVHDIANNPQITRWREEAIRNGYGSYIALPLLQGSSAVGVLSIYASETDAFDEKEVELLKELAGNLAYGIRSLRNEVERRRAEAAVRESEQRYRMLFERNPQPMWIFDLGTLRFLEVNDAAISHYGYSYEEFLQMTITDIRSPEDIPEVLANVGKRDDGYDFTGTFRHRKKDGSIILAEVSRYAFVQNGRRVRLVLANDVTERRRAEDGLRASEQRYRALFENNLAAVFRVSEPGRLLDCNEAACQMLGYSREELLALDLRMLYCDLAVREAGKKLLYASGKLSNYKVDLRRKDGTVVSVLTNLTLLHEEAGKAPVIAGVMLDVTEVGKLQEQLLQSQKLEAIGKLTGGIAHDFNNILMIINSYSEIVLDKVEAQSPLRRPLEQIRTAAARAASLTRQLLAFSRKQVMAPVVLNLAGVLSDLKEMLKRLIGEDIALEIVAPESLWLTKADVSQIQQVIFNLAVNARDAMPNGGKLVLRAANAELGEEFVNAHAWGSVGQYVVLAVSDTGFGMSPEIQSRIFEPFFTTKEPGQGTGLGLSTVYGIVKQSGGYITVESEPGGGTTFYIYLPRVMEVRVPRTEEQAEVAGTLRATILLVEDEDATREAITDYLEQNAFQVVGVASAEEALRTCERLPAGRIDVLLTDVVMPGMSGIDLASKLRSQLSEIKVIFISGYTDDVLVRSGINPAQITLLSKPFRLSDLVSKLQEVLTSSQPV